jgi:hypothetical protein
LPKPEGKKGRRFRLTRSKSNFALAITSSFRGERIVKTLADLQKEWRHESDTDFGDASIIWERCAVALSPFVKREDDDYKLIMALKNELYSYCAHPRWNKELVAKAIKRLDE